MLKVDLNGNPVLTFGENNNGFASYGTLNEDNINDIVCVQEYIYLIGSTEDEETGYDCYILKLDCSTGEKRPFNNEIISTDKDDAFKGFCEVNGKVYCAGYSKGPFAGEPNVYNTGILVKYDDNGNILKKIQFLDPDLNTSTFQAVTYDPTLDKIVAGGAGSSMTGIDALLVWFDHDTLEEKDYYTFGSPERDQIAAVVASYYIYTAGYTAGVMNSGQVLLGNSDFFTGRITLPLSGESGSGTNVVADLDPVLLKFSEISVPGFTGLKAAPKFPPLPPYLEKRGAVYQVRTTAEIGAGPIDVTIKFSSNGLSIEQIEKLELIHYEYNMATDSR